MMAQLVSLPPAPARNPGGCDRAAAQRNGPVPAAAWYGNVPLLRALWQSHNGQVAARVDQRCPYPVLAQLCQGSINRHAFGNSPKVELNVPGQRHTAMDRIDLDAAPAPARLAGNDR